ncbi:MAG: N-6 DNA methylase [Kiritimatiellae bacterium]|nr:N-6 DNA methylase [Kiritimatiellia bacterium]
MELFSPVTDFAGRSVHSQSQHWCTPPQYVDAVKRVFGGEIELDPCSNEQSIVHAKYEFKLPEKDGLVQEWDFASVYVNPPYGADRTRGTTIRNWLAKCSFTRTEYGAQIIALIPVATNTLHWKKYVFGDADAICFLFDTRLRFLVNGNTDNKGAPMACAMIYWGDFFCQFETVFKEYGAVLSLESLKKNKKMDRQMQMSLFG